MIGLSGLVAACSSSHPTSKAANAAITSAWTTFFNGATPVAEKAAVLQGGTNATTDIHLFFALLPATFTTKIDAIQLNGTTATVTYEFFAGTSKLSAQPMTGTAVLVGGKWSSARRRGRPGFASPTSTAAGDRVEVLLGAGSDLTA